MAIPVTNPVVVPATTSQTYDTLWLSFLQVQAGDPNRAVRVMAEVCKAATVDGKLVLAPTTPGLKTKGTLVINDIFAAAATDTATITLPNTLGGAGPAVTLGLADILTVLELKIKQLAEAASVI